MRNQRGRNKRKKISPLLKFFLILVIILLSIGYVFLNKFSGKYSKNNVLITEDIKLNLTDKINKVDFEFVTLNKKVKGSAKKDLLGKAKFKKEDLEIEFKNNLNKIVVKCDGNLEKVGIYSSIKLDGEYIKGKPVYKEQNRVTSIFYTEKMQQEVKEMYKESYKDLEEIILSAAIEDKDYELDARVYEVSKTGSKKTAIILVDNNEHFYIGFFDGEKFTYNTNDAEYKEAIPQKIKLYANINGYEI